MVNYTGLQNGGGGGGGGHEWEIRIPFSYVFFHAEFENCINF